MLSKRLSRLKPSPTLALAAKAKELKAQGKDVISLSVGEPDWDTFDFIKEEAIKAIQEGQTKYTPSAGIPELRKAIAKQVNGDFNMNYEPTEVTVSIGGKFVIFSALQSLIDPGDEVIIPAPYWVSYPSMVELCDGVPVTVSCGKESGYKLTLELLKNAISEKTKLLILNTPSNPTGFMYSQEELAALADTLKEHPQVVVMSDDIYNRLVFSDQGLAPHILTSHPEFKERMVIVNGLAKSYSMTGWRVGWALGPAEVISAMSRLQSQSVSCASPFSQRAAIVAIEKGDEAIRQSIEVLKDRCDFVCAGLEKIEGVEIVRPDGAFYVWPDISSFLGGTFNGQKIETSKDFAAMLLEDQLVAAVPGIEFGLDGYLRLSYALSKDRMGEAVGRLAKFTQKIEK